VHVTLREPREAARLLAGALERRTPGDAGPRALVVTPTVDDALALCETLSAGDAGDGVPHIVPLTGVSRAQRSLAGRPAVVIGPLSVLSALIAQAQLKLSSLDTLGLVWIEELARADQRPALEALLAEVPREAHRIALASRPDAALDEFLERAMWRARRVTHVPDEPPAAVEIRYVLAAREHRVGALSATLDALNPSSCVVIVGSDDEERAARHAAKVLGYSGDEESVSVAWELPESEVELVVFFAEPPDADAIRAAAAVARRVVTLIPTAALPRLRAMTGTAARPLLESDTFAAARTAEDALRAELQDVLVSGAANAHLLLLEPLVAEHDATEVAAAAVALLRRERQKIRRKAVAPARPAEAPASPREPVRDARRAPAGDGHMTRVFLSVGERDGVRRGDLVGAIAGEAGITGAQIGRIELRDSHAVVEVASDVAARVIEKMNGTNIRGRRVAAREDRERETRGTRPARSPGGERGGARRDFTKGRGPRNAGRTGPGRSGPSRNAPRDETGPRAARESREWTERAERLRHARRGPAGPPRNPAAGED
jgi:ATP-dependent RNA helicase DeaD